jgi:DNA-binding NtrC family response regulator
MSQKVSIQHRRYAGSQEGRSFRISTGIWMRHCPCGAMPSNEDSFPNLAYDDRHVMLVQSRAIELRAVADMIRALGFRVTPVEEGGKALSFFDRQPCEVVISDLDMQQINGYDLAWHIRRHSPRTRILLMTACCQAEVVDFMDQRVVDGWLFKPFGIEVLKDMLE